MIDIDAFEAKQEKVRVALKAFDDCEKAIAYNYLFNTGQRIDGISHRILSLAPKKTG